MYGDNDVCRRQSLPLRRDVSEDGIIQGGDVVVT